MCGRDTILFLVDEIEAAGLPRDTRRLIERLAQNLDVVVVAQCYLRPGHRARRLPAPCEFYAFPPENFEADVAAFAATIAARHRPRWIVAYGWENPQLVAALDVLDLPILLFLDAVERGPHAEVQIYKVFRHVTQIVFGDRTVLESLTMARWALEARDFRVLELRASRRTPAGWTAMLRQFAGAPSPGEAERIAGTAAAITEAGARCAAAKRTVVENRARDARLIDEAAAAFDTDLYLPARMHCPKDAAILDYLRASQLAVPRDRPFAGRLLRRPLAGFHPLIYASDNADFDEAAGEDPLAHFVRAGRPPGRWSHPVLRPGAETTQPGGPAAIHGHFHYPDLLPELLERLAANRTAPDLFLTTTSTERRDEITRCLDAAGVQPKLLAVGRNRGRDIWPFLDLLQQGAFGPYAAVGHVHSKRSPHYDQGEIWRDFLWTHLIGGGRHATMDTVLGAFTADPVLGLVFAEDPYLTGWEENAAPATALAERAGLSVPLPNYFEYPVGTMFWVRPDALAPLADLRLTIGELPAEPLPEDGTILHALERLLPFLVARAGFGYATTHVEGSRR